MDNKFFDALGGIITLSLRGSNQEKIINIALTRGIYIWDIKRNGDIIQLKVRSSAYKALKNITDEHNYDLEILDKKGLPFYKTLLKRRMGFLGGAVIFILTLYIMSSFVWFIQVSGNNKVETRKILMSAASHGVYQGSAKWNFNRNEAEQAILRDLSELSYVQCDIRGVKAHIKVVEKILPGNEVTGPCHIVASKDGIIEDVLVLEGQANVKPGDVVGKGDILISGIVFPPVQYGIEVPEGQEQKPYHVRARGQVKSRTWYEGYGECYLRADKKIFTGRKTTKLYFETPWKNFLLKGDRESSFQLYEQGSNKKTLRTAIGNWSLYKLILKEQVIEIKEYKEDEAIEIARERALKNLRTQMKEPYRISDSHVDILSSPSDPIVRIKLSVETIEDISRALPIEMGDISNKSL